jgi:hypothetical protein
MKTKFLLNHVGHRSFAIRDAPGAEDPGESCPNRKGRQPTRGPMRQRRGLKSVHQQTTFREKVRDLVNADSRDGKEICFGMTEKKN